VIIVLSITLYVSADNPRFVLLNSQLPDGNYDERSQHAAKPVKAGEKWLTNLWAWVRLEQSYGAHTDLLNGYRAQLTYS
jgi:hypothetical protein